MSLFKGEDTSVFYQGARLMIYGVVDQSNVIICDDGVCHRFSYDQLRNKTCPTCQVCFHVGVARSNQILGDI